MDDENVLKRYIIVIDDDEMLGDIIVKKLIEAGYRCTWEKNGKNGLRRASEQKPDLVLLDLILPDISGMEVLLQMHAHPDLADVPVIIISNIGTPAELQRIVSLGATDYIIKADFSPNEIVEKISKCLGNKTNPSTQTSNSLRTKHVLVVEDDRMLSALSVTRLRKEGYQVSLVEDGQQCLLFLKNDPLPDLLLLDIIMPGVNGFEVLKAMKRDDRLSHIPVIIFSNFAQEHEIEAAKELGADEFLVKSKYTLKEVVEHIGKVLGQTKA